ncbi:MAG: DUF6265 family protein [Gemmatimonadaceae bacterium]
MMMNAAAIFALVSLSPAGTHAQAPALDTLGWLTGCWELSAGDRRTVEQWERTPDGELRGSSVSFKGTTETGSERMRIHALGGAITFWAYPSSQQPAEFRAIAVGAREATFENPEHDFPQRISYRRQGGDSLVARIEGDRDGRRRSVTFGFRAISCTAR